MHGEARAWVTAHSTTEPIRVLDLGGRNVNGSLRELFPNATYLALDIAVGPGVDIVADAATWTPTRLFDVVLCTEVFEHTPVWPQIVGTAFAALVFGGLFVATMAGPNRPAHGADGSSSPHAGEHYANITGPDLLDVLTSCGFTEIEIDERPSPSDVRCTARKGA